MRQLWYSYLCGMDFTAEKVSQLLPPLSKVFNHLTWEIHRDQSIKSVLCAHRATQAKKLFGSGEGVQGVEGHGRKLVNKTDTTPPRSSNGGACQSLAAHNNATFQPPMENGNSSGNTLPEAGGSTIVCQAFFVCVHAYTSQQPVDWIHRPKGKSCSCR